MFIVVRYGDDKQEIFNPDCLIGILLKKIKEKCEVDKTDTVELADSAGNVKNLHKNPMDYGTDYFTERESLVLLRVEKDMEIDEERPLFVPLLEGKDEDEIFLGNLNPKNLKPASAAKRRQTRSKAGAVPDKDSDDGKSKKNKASNLKKNNLAVINNAAKQKTKVTIAPTASAQTANTPRKS